MCEIGWRALYALRATRRPSSPMGITALEAFGAERPDVIVADVMLPGVDGLALCRTLRSEMHVTLILLLASRTATSDLVAGVNAGADDWMVQPVSVLSSAPGCDHWFAMPGEFRSVHRRTALNSSGKRIQAAPCSSGALAEG